MNSLAIFRDPHNDWQLLDTAKVYRKKGYHVILLGDYVDSFGENSPIAFLNEVINFHKAGGVTLIEGNHDSHYFRGKYAYKGSGFQDVHYPALWKLYTDNRERFEAAKLIGPYLFSHAGFTDPYVRDLQERYGCETAQDIVDVSNQWPREYFYLRSRDGGYDPYSGPSWLRPWDYIPCLNDYTQIVGHTHAKFENRMNQNLFVLGSRYPLLIEL